MITNVIKNTPNCDNIELLAISKGDDLNDNLNIFEFKKKPLIESEGFDKKSINKIYSFLTGE